MASTAATSPGAREEGDLDQLGDPEGAVRGAGAACLHIAPHHVEHIAGQVLVDLGAGIDGQRFAALQDGAINGDQQAAPGKGQKHQQQCIADAAQADGSKQAGIGQIGAQLLEGSPHRDGHEHQRHNRDEAARELQRQAEP